MSLSHWRTCFDDDPFDLRSEHLGEGNTYCCWRNRSTLLRPDMDLKEKEKDIVIELELPGVKSEDIHISLQGNLLNILGEKTREKKKDDERFICDERIFGSFRRTLKVPAGTEESDIESHFFNGLLEIVIPKKCATILDPDKVVVTEIIVVPVVPVVVELPKCL